MVFVGWEEQQKKILFVMLIYLFRIKKISNIQKDKLLEIIAYKIYILKQAY